MSGFDVWWHNGACVRVLTLGDIVRQCSEMHTAGFGSSLQAITWHYGAGVNGGFRQPQPAGPFGLPALWASLFQPPGRLGGKRLCPHSHAPRSAGLCFCLYACVCLLVFVFCVLVFVSRHVASASWSSVSRCWCLCPACLGVRRLGCFTCPYASMHLRGTCRMHGIPEWTRRLVTRWTLMCRGT